MTPKKQEKKFQRTYAREILRIAQADLESAQLLASNVKVRKENTAFMAQQAIEKALKAVLVALDMPVPLVHDAGILIAKMPATINPPQGYELSELTAFATVRRYEEGFSPLTSEELRLIVRTAEEMVVWAQQQVSTVLGPPSVDGS